MPLRHPFPAPATGPSPAGLPPGPLSDIGRLARRLARDEKGNFLVFVGLSVSAFFGFVALSFDLGRMAAVQTDLQSFADSVALAAAAELDGQDDSIARACAAAALVADTQSFAAGGRDLTMADVGLVFLDALPADDADTEVAGAVVATVANPSAAACEGVDEEDQRDAILVRVDVDPHGVQMYFASVVAAVAPGATLTGNPSATATAGFTQYACDIAPVFFCLPRETNDAGEDTGPGGLSIGQMLHLRAGGGDGKWAPGNFGLLDVESAYDPAGSCKDFNGENRIRCLLGAIDTVTQCYSVRGVDTDPGNSVGITVPPLNFRFDLWASGGFSRAAQGDPDFAPAPNVIYGQEPAVTVATTPGKRGAPPTTTVTVDHCSPTSDASPLVEPYLYPAGSGETSIGLPRGAFEAETDGDAGRFGVFTAAGGTFRPGSDDRLEYMAANHNAHDGEDPFPDAMTRWEVYLAEIEAAGGGSLLPPMEDAAGDPVALRDGSGNVVRAADGSVVNARQETGRAECAAPVSDPYRRVLVAAAIDCEATLMKGRDRGVPVVTFYEMFLTEPLRDLGGGDLDLFGEVIGIAGGTGSGSTSNGIFRDVVQLYR